MIPNDHISLLIADGRRAKEWRLSLSREGFQARQIPTRGSDAARGDFWIAVPRSQRVAAQRFVSRVLAGEQQLLASAPVSGPLMWGAAAIVVALATLLVLALVT